VIYPDRSYVEQLSLHLISCCPYASGRNELRVVMDPKRSRSCNAKNKKFWLFSRYVLDKKRD